jgi:predicted amidohydrolase YtcJ
MSHPKSFLLSTFFLLLSTLAGAQGNQTAETVLVHARIYTVNAKQPWADALAIKDGKILAVGTNKQIEALRGSSTRRLDAKGDLVLPGFTDCHIHCMDGSLGLDRETREGSLEPGKLADLIVLGQDLFKVPASSLSKTEVMLTMVGGRVVYQAPAWARACCSGGGQE